MSYQFNTDQLAWLSALRSGNYQQTTGYLHDDKGYCCLGVACEVLLGPGELSRRKSNNKKRKVPCYEWEGEFISLPRSLVERLKLVTNHGYFSNPIVNVENHKAFYNLTELNDELRWSFEQIADFLEANPYRVFTGA